MNKRTKGDIIYDCFNYFLISMFAIVCIFPFIYVLSYSITPYTEYIKNPMRIIPNSISLIAYKELLRFPLIYSGYRMTLFITIVGTAINIFLLSISAYPLSKKELKGRTFVLGLILFTMFFSGGLIPNYYLVRTLGLLNTPWAMILPGAISAYNLILMKNFIGTIPDSLEESAVIDGANEITVLIKIILPLSMPAIATFTLFHAVAHWNTFFSAVIYVTKRENWPLMLVLREMVIEGNTSMINQGIAVDNAENTAQSFTIKMAVIVITILPIIMLYPFLQKYFMKGLLLGSIKG